MRAQFLDRGASEADARTDGARGSDSRGGGSVGWSIGAWIGATSVMAWATALTDSTRGFSSAIGPVLFVDKDENRGAEKALSESLPGRPKARASDATATPAEGKR